MTSQSATKNVEFLHWRNECLIDKKTWREFRESGMLWFINMILHTFGWSIVYEIDSDTDEISSVFPARVKFRGFSSEYNNEGYIKVSKFLKSNADKLLKEAED